MIELAPVSPNSSNEMGNRAYNWDKKQVRSSTRFATSAASVPFRHTDVTCVASTQPRFACMQMLSRAAPVANGYVPCVGICLEYLRDWRADTGHCR